MIFGSGRPYAALLDNSCTAPSGGAFQLGGELSCTGVNGPLNDTAVNQTTANSALGISGAGPSTNVGLNSYPGP